MREREESKWSEKCLSIVYQRCRRLIDCDRESRTPTTSISSFFFFSFFPPFFFFPQSQIARGIDRACVTRQLLRSIAVDDFRFRSSEAQIGTRFSHLDDKPLEWSVRIFFFQIFSRLVEGKSALLFREKPKETRGAGKRDWKISDARMRRASCFSSFLGATRLCCSLISRLPIAGSSIRRAITRETFTRYCRKQFSTNRKFPTSPLFIYALRNAPARHSISFKARITGNAGQSRIPRNVAAATRVHVAMFSYIRKV